MTEAMQRASAARSENRAARRRVVIEPDNDGGSMSTTEQERANDGYREALRRARDVNERRRLKPSTAPVSETGGTILSGITPTDADGFPEDAEDVVPRRTIGATNLLQRAPANRVGERAPGIKDDAA
jgi:hypothetical protein